MIEIEIRGVLTVDQYETLKDLLRQSGAHVEDQKREMILLYGYPGFDIDPLKRAVDIRLRNTNGKCEVMIKRKVSDNNVGREELSVVLEDTDLEKLKDMAKVFGITRGLWMRREKEIFVTGDIEWSLTKAISRDGSRTFYFYEAEMLHANNADINTVQATLHEAAKKYDLPVCTPDEYKAFVETLGREVNEEIDL